jgi:hypothetical protein
MLDPDQDPQTKKRIHYHKIKVDKVLLPRVLFQLELIVGSGHIQPLLKYIKTINI